MTLSRTQFLCVFSVIETAEVVCIKHAECATIPCLIIRSKPKVWFDEEAFCASCNTACDVVSAKVAPKSSCWPVFPPIEETSAWDAGYDFRVDTNHANMQVDRYGLHPISDRLVYTPVQETGSSQIMEVPFVL